MEGQKVHEYSVEIGTNGLPIARLGKVHNLITFVRADAQKVHYLDGKWVDDGKNQLPIESIPQEFQDAVATIPFTPDRAQTDVLVNCEFCEFTGPGKEYARHLANVHIRNRPTVDPAVGAGSTVEPEAEALDQRRFTPADLPPDNYVLDDEGFVVLNKDGTPRRKAGRPRTEPETIEAKE